MSYCTSNENSSLHFRIILLMYYKNRIYSDKSGGSALFFDLDFWRGDGIVFDMQFTKPTLSIQQMIDLLKQRDLIFDDEEKAKHYLLHIWYFRLSGYCKYYQDTTTDKFYSWVTFDQVISLYKFDRKLRLLMLSTIEKLEISIKSIINTVMCKNHNPFRYIQENVFKEKLDKDWNNIAIKTLDIIKWKKSKSASMFVKAYNEKYVQEEHLPGWMLVEELTLWEISTIYSILQDTDAKEIAMYYQTYVLDLERRLQVLVNIRNISAHHSRLRNRKYTAKPRVNDVIFKHRYIIEKNENGWKEVVPNFYNVCLILHYLLDTIAPNHHFIDQLQELFDEFPWVPLASMGFIIDWKEKIV